MKIPDLCLTCRASLINVVAYEAFIIKHEPVPRGGDPNKNPPQYNISTLGPFCVNCWEDMAAEMKEQEPCWRNARIRLAEKLQKATNPETQLNGGEPVLQEVPQKDDAEEEKKEVQPV